MHRHRKVLPIVRCNVTHRRSTATAAKVKPRPWDNSAPAPRVASTQWPPAPANYTQHPSRGKEWPTQTIIPSGLNSGSERSTSASSSPHSSRPTPKKWALPTSTPPLGSTLSSSVIDTLSGLPSSLLAVPPRRISAVPSSATSSRPLLPPRLSQSPSSGALNGWTRTAPTPASEQDQRQGTVSRLQLQPPDSRRLPKDDPRLQQYTDKTLIPSPAEQSSPFNRSRDSAISQQPTNRRIPASETEARSRKFAVNKPGNVPVVDQSRWDKITGTRIRPFRETYKSRGSLLARLDEETVKPNTRGNQAQNQDSAKLKKPRPSLEKRSAVDVYIPSTVSVGTLARLLNVRLEHLQQRMRRAGMADEATYDYVLTSGYAVLLAEEFGRNPIINDEAAFDIYPSPPHPNPSSLPSRPPVVTIMGHVDHGKTTLLDTLRSASVAKGEAGGITQHIGAFSVPVDNGNSSGTRSITFLDTPGHAAFSAMRARGAGVTDIVVLVVAADDGIMPQTKEVIDLIKKDAGKIGVVVAINKVDKPGINVDNVHKALMAENVQLEVFGGDIPSVEVSGLTGHGLPDLVETLSAMSEMQDLRAERDGPVQGYILESKIHKGLGAVATVLILRGCLKPGSHIICGVSYAKIRAMSDSTGAAMKTAYPGMAVTVSGWKTLPNAGDEVLGGNEAAIKKAITNRLHKADIEASLVDVEAINSTRRRERERRVHELGDDAKEIADKTSTVGPKELRLIIKADVSGSAEAVVGALQGIGNKEAVTKIVSSGVGDISESDVMMAKAVGGLVVGFSVSTPRAIENLAAQNGITICSSSIIYRLMDDVKQHVIALLPVITETRVTGEATVLQLFDIHLKAKQTMKVAGCRVINGVVEKTRFSRVIRDGVTIHEGTLDTMRHLKKDVVEVRKGSECGLSFTAFADLREGDLIQMYEKIEKPGAL